MTMITPILPKPIVTFCCTLLLAANIAVAQNSKEPSEADKLRYAPFKFTEASANNGKQIYQQNCQSCHGEPGKGNYAKLDPIPYDPVSSEFQSNADGEMFWYVSNGKGQMPNFSSVITETQRWEVISYIRTFNDKYVQIVAEQGKDAVLTSSIKLEVEMNQDSSKIIVTLTDTLTSPPQPVSNARVSLWVERQFGKLPIAEQQTNNNGIALFDTPTDIPGNETGMLTLIAQANSQNLDNVQKAQLGIGTPTSPKNLLADRAIWAVNAKAPIWVITLYLTGVLSVLLTIAYVMLQLKKIRDLNSSNKSKPIL